MKRTDIQTRLSRRRDQLAVIFKRYKLKLAPTPEALEIGYRKYGNQFAMDIAQVLQEDPAVKTDGGFMSTLAASPTPGTTNGEGSGGDVFDFIGGLFDMGGDLFNNYLDKKYGGVVVNPGGTPAPVDSGGFNRTTLIMIGMGLVVFILLLVLILKR